MPLGTELKNKFDIEVANNGYPQKEIPLFRCLITAMQNLANYQSCEIHGTKYQVTYKESLGWFTKKPRCELGDMAILAFSPKKKEARLVIVQNKLSSGSRSSLGSTSRKVHANLVQLELLRERPYFERLRGPNSGIPNGLIKNTRFASVCQYGIFYDNGCGADMSAITANQFDIPSMHTRTGKHPSSTITFHGNFQNLHNYDSKPDFIAAETLVDFGDLLEMLYIGRPITSYIKPTLDNVLFRMIASSPNADVLHMDMVSSFWEMEITNKQDDYYTDRSTFKDYTDRSTFKADFLNFSEYFRSFIMLNVDRKYQSF